ncbi:MAG: hypothetical protein LRY27_02775 [Chitinophagales bacterium]|nr:hypothetical protein [Chitinophagales bacterium]
MDISVQEMNINTAWDVRNVLQLSEDTLFICGGNLWSAGFIARSIDSGQNWEIVYDHWKIILKITTNSKKDIFAGSYFGGTHFSIDGGNTWAYNEHGEIAPVNDYLFFK